MELEATIVAKYSAVAPVLDERSRRRWAAAESLAIGYGGDALVSSATGLARCQRSFKFPPPAVIENSPTPWLIKR